MLSVQLICITSPGAITPGVCELALCHGPVTVALRTRIATFVTRDLSVAMPDIVNGGTTVGRAIAFLTPGTVTSAIGSTVSAPTVTIPAVATLVTAPA